MPQRIQLRRIKGWTMPADTVRVARPGRWGNPFVIGRWYCRGYKGMTWAGGKEPPADRTGWVHITNGIIAVEWYRWYADFLIERGIRTTPDGATFAEELLTLRGKNLACWCKPNMACHADILLQLANPGGSGTGVTNVSTKP